MEQKMSESRKKFVDMMLGLRRQDELAQAKEKVNKRVEALQKELSDIAERAYQNAVGEIVSEYQAKVSAEGLAPAEIEAIQRERKEFEANPAAFGVIREKCEIKDEADKRRALEIVGLLNDTKQLGEDTDADFLEMVEGFGDRQLSRMTDGERQGVGSK